MAPEGRFNYRDNGIKHTNYIQNARISEFQTLRSIAPSDPPHANRSDERIIAAVVEI